jgi:hypothetical protein
MLLYINDPQGMSNSKGFYVTKVKHEVITTLNVAHLSITFNTGPNSRARWCIFTILAWV